MVRTRLAALAAAAGLGLASGCAGLSEHSLFSRCHGTTCSAPCDCCPAECASGFDFGGPVLDEGAPFFGQPQFQSVPPMGTPPAPPGEVMPQLTAPPRLVPQPQGPATPYTPSYQSRTVGR
jgi:hypothetical protein